jgi:hypothetical protein
MNVFNTHVIRAILQTRKMATVKAPKFEYAVFKFGYTSRFLEPGPLIEGPLSEPIDLRYVQYREREDWDPYVSAVPLPDVYYLDRRDNEALIYINPKSFKGEEEFGPLPAPYIRDPEAEAIVEDITTILPRRNTYGCVVLELDKMEDVMEYCSQIKALEHCGLYDIYDIRYGTTPGGRRVINVIYDSESG